MNKQELKSKIEKLEKGLASKVTPENLKASLKSQKAKFEKELADLEKKEKKDKAAVSDKIKALKDKVKSKVSSITRDGARKAKKAGKRIAEDGSVYYEKRANRTDSQTKKKPYLEKGGELEGMTADIFRSDYDSPTNKMYGKKSVTIIDKEVPKIFEPSESAPAVRLIRRNIGWGKNEYNYIHAIPYDQPEHRGMFGGTFIYSSDSRFPAKFPIPLHDRVEGYEKGGDLDMESEEFKKQMIKNHKETAEHYEKMLQNAEKVGQSDWDIEQIKKMVAFHKTMANEYKSDKMAKGGLTKNETLEVAEKFAKALSKSENKKVTVNIRTLEEDSFDLDMDGEQYDGGSYNIYSNGDVKNMAISGSPVYGKTTSTEDEIVKNLSKMSKGGSVNSIEKRVAEVNELIKRGNELGIEVVDSSTTWQAPMKFKPLKYTNGVLYVEYEELDLYANNKGMGRNWETKKYKVTKYESAYGGKGEDAGNTQKSVLSDIAKMYRKPLKSYDTYGYFKDGGETQSKRYTVNVYYGGEMQDEEFYTDSLEEAERLSQGGEHSEIYDNEKKEFVEIEYAKGGMFEFKPYGKTKGKFKITYMAYGRKHSEIWETKEMAVSNAKRYASPKMMGEYTDIEVIDSNGNSVDYMAKGGGIYSSDSLYYLQVLKDGEEVGREKFRAKSLKEAREIAEDDYEKEYQSKFGDHLSFIVSEAMEEGAELSNGFSIDEMKEYLNDKFSDSFGFKVYPIKKGTTFTPDYDAEILKGRSLKGLSSSDLGYKKLVFPKYKKSHDINYEVTQGGENTYFEFLLSDIDGDKYYAGTFGFKDQGDVDSEYITRFIAFLMKSYGLPFKVEHSVYAKGGATGTNKLIKDFYIDKYPTDELGVEINEKSTFDGLYKVLDNKGDVYHYIGVSDSLVRERVFEKLSELMGVEYDVIYQKWLDSDDEYAKGGETNYTKKWKVVGITIQGKRFEKEIILGRMSDKNDVMNALKRMPDTQIREVTLIEEKMAEGGSVSQNISVFGYETLNYDICPLAIEEFEKAVLALENSEDSKKIALSRVAMYVDDVFGVEKQAKVDNSVSKKEFEYAVSQSLVAASYNYAAGLEINLFKFIPMHISEIASKLVYVTKNVNREELTAYDLLVAKDKVGESAFKNMTVDERKNLAREYKESYAEGGSIEEGNYRMVVSQAKEIKHHADELLNVLTPDIEVEAWVVSKIERASTDLSDITHYIDGLTPNAIDEEVGFEEGGQLEKGVYYLGKPKKEGEVWGQKIVELDENGLSFATDYARKLKDFPSKDYKKITEEELSEFIKNSPKHHNVSSDASKFEHYANGGMIAGRWYRDNQGVEHRYIGEDSTGQSLFSDGQKVSAKSLDDFESDTKEKKSFSWFKEGGETSSFSNARLLGRESQDFEKEAREYAGADWDKMSKDEKEQIISDLQKDFDRSSHFAKGGYMAQGGELNLGIRKMAQEEGFTPRELGKEYELTMAQAVVEALTDANYHDAARKLVSLLEKNPKIAIKPNYPNPSDPKFKEKMAEIEKEYGSKYWEADDKTRNFAIKVSQKSGWDGYAIAGAFEYLVRVDGGYHKLADNIEKAMESSDSMAKGGYVAVSEKDGYWYIMSKPTTKDLAEQLISLGVPRGEEGKVVTIKEAKEHKKVIGAEYLADGGKVKEIDMDEVESSAKFYTDESKWSTKPTIKKFQDEIDEYETLKSKLDKKEITPSKVIGTGYKSQLARPLAYRWLNERILVAKRAIEILKERGDKMADGGEIQEYAVYELYLGQPYNFWNDENKKWYWSEPQKATLYTKKEAEEKRENLLTPRRNIYSKKGDPYKEIHIGNLYQKGLLKKMAKGGEVKVGDVYERKGFGKLKITKIDDGKFRKVYFKYDDNDKEFFEGMYGAEGKIGNKEWVKVNDKMAKGGKVTFDEKVKAIKASLLKTKKVPKKVQKDYGKTYNAKEAEQAAKRIVGSMRKKGMK